MVRYTGPPADRQRGGQPPTSIYQTKTGKGCDKNSQATENKEVIRKNNVLFATPDEGDDGVGSVIDTTKVTSSTPADQHLPQSYDGTIRRSLQPGSAALNRASGGRKTGEKNHTKGQKWAVQHAKTAWSGGQVVWFCYRAGRSSSSQTEQKQATY
ncbi:hypothetical protein [Aeromonas jandaei]|uniref:hypothetical protein n=1 Tax=Aeromonas jandaei TaxID=650 RepID=UPI002AA0B3FD|nr:hypothetical protein [Aeromonas jandaei]